MGKYSIASLREEYAKEGWKLLEDKYQNLSTAMKCECPEGHINYLPYEKWRKHHECPLCARSALKTTLAPAQVVPKSPGTQRILALDQATKVSGWAIFDNNKLVQYGVFTSPHENSVEKISDVKNWLTNMVLNWRPDRVIFEDIQYQKTYESNKTGEGVVGVTTFKVLAQLQGVIENVLFENGITFDAAHTATWREYSGVKGQSRTDKKRSAQLIVKDIYNVSVGQDEADAICIGRYGLSLHKKVEFSEWA